MNPLELIYLKVFKLVCLVIRPLSRKLYFKYPTAKNFYYWSDFQLFNKVDGIYIIPGFLYRLVVFVFELIISLNTIDQNNFHCRSLGNFADTIIHPLLARAT